MKTYQLQENRGDEYDSHWFDVGLPTQSIKYIRGLQDGIQWMQPKFQTRIVEKRGCKLVVVRMCANWRPF